jgi:hypothetical protein
MTERIETHALGPCYRVHRKLADAAALLSRRLAGVHDDADLLQLGASCMRIAADHALQAMEARQALRSWRECALAERQIRLGTFRLLRDGCIDNAVYDDLFRLATQAARIREDERLRARRQLLRLDIV